MISLKSALGLGFASLAAMNASAQKASTFKPITPNIVLILMDDMGYGDIGRTGANQYDTPNLNRSGKPGNAIHMVLFTTGCEQRFEGWTSYRMLSEPGWNIRSPDALGQKRYQLRGNYNR